MFTQKMQNPFLKPSPIFSTNNYANVSYGPPLPSSNKYSSYVPYQAEKGYSYDSYSNNIEREPQISQPPKYRPSSDLNDILKNNPFNRPSTSIFTGSSANTYSPAKYDAPKNYDNYQAPSFERKQSNDIYSKSRGNYGSIDIVPSSNQYSANRHTPKKYDNYLSTSSADSAVTYINKIYDIDEDKSQGLTNISNPFLRRNLIQDKSYQKETKPSNSYDNATLKYIATQKQYERAPYRENNYLTSNKPQYPAYEPPFKSKEYIPQARDYSGLQYKAESYSSKEPKMNSYKAYDDSKTSSYMQMSEKEPYVHPPSSNRYIDSKHSNYDNKYETNENKYDKYDFKEDSNKYENKYDKYEPDYEPSKEKINSKKDIYSQNYKQYQTYENKDIEKYEKIDSKYNFDESGHQKKSKKYIAHEIKDEYEYKHAYEEPERRNQDQNNGYDYKYSFNPYSQKDCAKQSKKSQEKVVFQESQNSLSQSLKYKPKEYPGAFQTLGGQPQFSKPRQESYTAPHVASKKLISSQVQEYQAHRQKFNDEKDSEPSKLQSKFVTYEQDEQEYNSRAHKTRGAVRDVEQSFPKVVQYNGMVFYRVQVK